jgi:hypothetical protein
MNQTHYLKLPKVGRQIIDTYTDSGDIAKLMRSIQANVDTQKTPSSKMSRSHQFIGLLRKAPFNLTTEQLAPIIPTDAEYDEIKAIQVENFQNTKHVDIITKPMFDMLLGLSDLTYLLMVTGRRVNEILFNRVEFKDGVMYVELSKNKAGDNAPLTQIYTLDNIADIERRFKRLRSKDNTHAVLYLNRKLKAILPEGFSKRSSHILRAIYVAFIDKFRNPGGLSVPQLIITYLNHDGASSVGHYQYIKLGDNITDVFTPNELPDYNARSVSDLRELAKSKGVRRYTKMNKGELIAALTE